jgi:hypothetical protein
MCKCIIYASYCNDRLMTTTTAALGLAGLATPLAVEASTIHSASSHLIVCWLLVVGCWWLCVYKQCEEKKISF